jgi:hypothetical protein
MRRRSLRLLLLTAYLGSYLPLTLAGSHVVANHGGADWRRDWLPKFLVATYHAPSGRARTRLTVAGVVFLPCIVADRLLWHRTEYDPTP